MINKLKLLISCALVGILVAIAYFLFESAVRNSINFIWNTTFDTANVRLAVVPIAVVGALIFFGLQHLLDPKSENHESHSLGGDVISPTFKNFGIIILLGYFSLLAGASLGPEAVLVPACMIIGGYIGIKLFAKDTMAIKVLGAAATMALMTAFFHSYIIGILSLLLITKQAKVKISLQLLIVAIVSCVSSYLTLQFIDPANKYFNFPTFSWKVALIDALVAVVLLIAGYAATFALKYAHVSFLQFRKAARLDKWWQLALVAGLVLSLLFLIGGPLIEFTGNQSISPLLSQAATLGLLGLLLVLITKILAIGWSKSMGYRGGLIFPMVFVASTLVALAQLYAKDANFGIGLIAAMVGIIAAERKAKILF